MLQYVAVCCSVLPFVAVCGSGSSHEILVSIVLCVVLRCSVLQCVAVCCSVLQCVAVYALR